MKDDFDEVSFASFVLPCGLSIGQNEFTNLKLWCSKVDQQPVLHPAGSHVSQDLSDVLIADCLNSLAFYEQRKFNQQIHDVFSQYRSILIVNRQRNLLPHIQSLFPQPMCQPVFVDLLQMTVPQVLVE